MNRNRKSHFFARQAFFAACLLASSLLSCTNYSSSQQIINPPVLLSIAREDTGHILTVAAQNTEIGFLGYRLYQASTEDAVRSLPAANGIDCGPFSVQPINSVEYVLEVKPNQSAVTPGQANRVCAFSGSLTSGRYVAIRSLVFGLTAVGTSEISNALLVP